MYLITVKLCCTKSRNYDQCDGFVIHHFSQCSDWQIQHIGSVSFNLRVKFLKCIIKINVMVSILYKMAPCFENLRLF